MDKAEFYYLSGELPPASGDFSPDSLNVSSMKTGDNILTNLNSYKLTLHGDVYIISSTGTFTLDFNNTTIDITNRRLVVYRVYLGFNEIRISSVDKIRIETYKFTDNIRDMIMRYNYIGLIDESTIFILYFGSIVFIKYCKDIVEYLDKFTLKTDTIPIITVSNTDDIKTSRELTADEILHINNTNCINIENETEFHRLLSNNFYNTVISNTRVSPLITYKCKNIIKCIDVDTCIICCDDFIIGENIAKLKCNHIYHEKCINEWFLTGTNKCPYCRQ